MQSLINLPETGTGCGSIILTLNNKLYKHEEGLFVYFVLQEGRRFNYDHEGDIKCVERGFFKNGSIIEGSILYKSGTLETGTFHKKILIKGEVSGFTKKKIDNSFFTKFL